MPKQTTVRLPDELADQAEAVARERCTSVKALIIDLLSAEIDRGRPTRTSPTEPGLLERDQDLLDRLAQ